MCLGSLSCWKVNLLPSLRFWMVWTGFSLRLSLYFGALSFSCVPQSLLLKNSPTAWGCYQHTLLLGWYSAGDEQCPGFFQTRCLELRLIRPDNLVSQSLSLLRVLFCTFLVCVLHWGEDWVWPHRHKDQIGGVLQWCLSFCRFLPSAYMIMELN